MEVQRIKILKHKDTEAQKFFSLCLCVFVLNNLTL
jgi:hypothetical protein